MPLHSGSPAVFNVFIVTMMKMICFLGKCILVSQRGVMTISMARVIPYYEEQ